VVGGAAGVVVVVVAGAVISGVVVIVVEEASEDRGCCFERLDEVGVADFVGGGIGSIEEAGGYFVDTGSGYMSVAFDCLEGFCCCCCLLLLLLLLLLSDRG